MKIQTTQRGTTQWLKAAVWQVDLFDLEQSRLVAFRKNPAFIQEQDDASFYVPSSCSEER